MKLTLFKKPSKRKFAISIIIIFLLIINIITAALIFFDIRVINSPEMTLDISINEINSNEIILETKLNIANPNQFGLVIKDLSAVTKTNKGFEVSNIIINGGEIKPNENKTFFSTDQIRFEEDLPKNLTTEITGLVGLNFLGMIKKTLPIVFKIRTSLEKVIENIAIPIITIKSDFGEITNDGIDFETEIEIKNQNNFEIDIEKLSIIIKNETEGVVGDFIIDGDLISAKSTTKLKGIGKILLKALNAETLFINLSAKAGLLIAGITESIDFSTEMQINIPDIGEILSSTTPTEAFIDADMKLTRQSFLSWGFTSDMNLRIVNPNTIGLEAKDVVFSIYRIDENGKILVGDCVVNESYVGPENVTSIPAKIVLPLKKIFDDPNKFLPRIPDGFLVVVRANITISGLDKFFWIGVSGYQDLHMFT